MSEEEAMNTDKGAPSEGDDQKKGLASEPESAGEQDPDVEDAEELIVQDPEALVILFIFIFCSLSQSWCSALFCGVIFFKSVAVFLLQLMIFLLSIY